jgi:Ser/Thr protein kinase RdoA (MazF antagonist)
MSQQMQQLFEESGLTSRHEPIDESLVYAALREHYGLDGELQRIDTEKDSTFRLRRDTGDYLVKVSPKDEPLPVVLCQTDVIDWVQSRDPGIPVQSVLRTRDGANHRILHHESGDYLGALRVLEFIPGTMLGEATPSPSQLAQVGAMLGRVDLALQGFAHEGLGRSLVWNIAEFMTLEPLLDYEADPERRAMAEEIFALYRERLEPVRHELRTQVLHGDLSAFNAVVDPDSSQFLTGVIDFGDVQVNPVIFDPAVLFANHLLPAPANPWQASRDMLVGYLEVFALSEDEIRLLAIASLARVALRALVTNWRIVHVPERAEYLRSHAREDWARIENTLNYGIDAGAAHLLTARDLAKPASTNI